MALVQQNSLTPSNRQWARRHSDCLLNANITYWQGGNKISSRYVDVYAVWLFVTVEDPEYCSNCNGLLVLQNVQNRVLVSMVSSKKSAGKSALLCPRPSFCGFGATVATDRKTKERTSCMLKSSLFFGVHDLLDLVYYVHGITRACSSTLYLICMESTL